MDSCHLKLTTMTPQANFTCERSEIMASFLDPLWIKLLTSFEGLVSLCVGNGLAACIIFCEKYWIRCVIGGFMVVCPPNEDARQTR